MRIVTQIITVIAISIILVTVGWSILIFNSSEVDQPVPFELEMNQNERTLTVGAVYLNMEWENIEIYEGEAKLPSGPIKLNDVITNCYGNVSLFLPGGYIFGKWVFNERPIIVDDLRFVGSWINSSQTITFDAKGNFYNYYIDPDDNSYLGYKDGTYDVKDKKIILNSNLNETESEDKLYNFYNNENSLDLINESVMVGYWRSIQRVRNSNDITEYEYQKIKMTGNLSVKNESFGYLTLTEDEEEVLIYFEGFNVENITDFDMQNVEIIGYIFEECDNDFWDGPCVKDIDSIEIVNE